ncbi:hypothetical protein [Aliarcobacter butzleri]|uniref:Uncharacterized protein n=6 Tax=root TaxID=1 RepID=A8EUF0_ALIB4|nr:hypothetical protein [Aliarcobacter butzleri]ABV67574.1 hypothetical protein Abu_1317 [Aliarcobacter butzleri RM4018]KLD96655.1 hypothetical protein AA20_11625 [Aliarcobacter butzleri L348]KLD98782.1 hypothetical protein AF74_02220 [Aliarcobacter butzleri L349]KLE01815.1 hypothetical protein AF76_03845 [Aliarcobacter butzleri L351]KLE06042.1 hypothetical protein AF77_03145 [Aliarcobacter butzleri L352]
MFKLSVNKDLFSKILSKKLYVIEKESSNYWKKELLEPIIIENKLTYKIKQINKLLITNGLGEDKPQIVIECLKIDFSQQKGIFEFYLGKILEQKNIAEIEVEDEKDILIKQLLNEKKELLNILNDIKKSKILDN